MGLNASYVLAPSIQMYFVDKDNGLPLANGQVFFFRDNDRNIAKPVYQISGAPPNYGYSVLPNPCILSSVGTFQDGSGNDILPYYLPYIDDSGDSAVDLYYIEVYNQDGVLQETREGWPNTVANAIVIANDITNFVSNGQFLLHNDSGSTPLSGTQVKSQFNYGGTIGNMDVYQVAPGGWTFQRNHSSTAVDSITFPVIAPGDSPSGNPPFAIQLATTLAGSDTAKDIVLTYIDVDTFASETQEYNLYFEGKSIGSAVSNCQIVIRKYYGSGPGASTSTETVVTNFSLTAAFEKFNTTILFGSNAGKTVSGTDSFVQIILRMPPIGTQTVEFTDFALILNAATLSSFPVQSPVQQISASTAGALPVPNPNGASMYLPIRLGPTGFVFDDTNIAKIFPAVNATPGIGELLCDGSTYQTSNYSLDGIPYSRLQAKLFNGTVPIYGTGSNFATAYISAGATQNIIFSTNKPGSATFPANGSASPGFSYAPIHTAAASGFGVNAYQYSSGNLLVFSTNVGAVTAPNVQNSGFTIVDIRNISAVNTNHIFSIATIAASGMTGGHYFTFTSLNPGATPYYVWFKIDGVGADPAPGGTAIEVDLLSTMTANDVAIAVQSALMGGNQTVITCVNAAGVANSSFWTFTTTNGNSYYVWYNKDGNGIDPKPGSAIGVEVDIATGDTNAKIASKTVIAFNKAYFGVPDFRGMYLRGFDPNGTWDFDTASRFGSVPGVFGDTIGTFMYDEFLSHLHSATSSSASTTTGTIPGLIHNYCAAGGSSTYDTTGSSTTAITASTTTTTTTTIGSTGQVQTSPVNANVYWMIRY